MAAHGEAVVEYEVGLAMAKRIRANRYLGSSFFSGFFFFQTGSDDVPLFTECSAKHDRGVRECFEEVGRFFFAFSGRCGSLRVPS